MEVDHHVQTPSRLKSTAHFDPMAPLAPAFTAVFARSLSPPNNKRRPGDSENQPTTTSPPLARAAARPPHRAGPRRPAAGTARRRKRLRQPLRLAFAVAAPRREDVRRRRRRGVGFHGCEVALPVHWACAATLNFIFSVVPQTKILS